MTLQNIGYHAPGKEAWRKRGVIVFATGMGVDEIVDNKCLDFAVEGGTPPSTGEVDCEVLLREIRSLGGLVSLQLFVCDSRMLDRQLLQVLEP